MNKYIGSWLKTRGNREKITPTSKICGPSRGNDKTIRPELALDRKNIRIALEASLKRFNTDYIDLYQLHWPQQNTKCFGELNYHYINETSVVTLLETLEALAEQGRERSFMSEYLMKPWGVMHYLQLAKNMIFHALPPFKIHILCLITVVKLD